MAVSQPCGTQPVVPGSPLWTGLGSGQQVQKATWAHYQGSCLFRQVLTKEKWQSLRLMWALASAGSNNISYAGTSREISPLELFWIAGTLSNQEPPRNRLSFTKTRFIRMETFLCLPSSQFKTGFVNQPRQTVLIFCDFAGTTSFCFLGFFVSETPSTLYYFYAEVHQSWTKTTLRKALFKHVKKNKNGTLYQRAADTPSHKCI